MPATPPASVRGTVYTPAQLAGAARAAGFPSGEIPTAVAVALAESSGRATVVSVSGDYGPWQINALAHPDKLTATTQWWDVGVSAQLAKRVYDESASRGNDGWYPWTVYRTGTYKEHLDTAAAGSGDGGAIDATAASNPVSAVGDMVGAIVAVGNAVKGVAQAVWRAMTWASDPHNWVRVALVAGGGTLVIGGLALAVKPQAIDAAKNVGKVVSVVTPQGKTAVSAASAAGKAA